LSYAAAFLLLAVALGVAVWPLSPPLALYLALSPALLAASYAGAGASLFGKRRGRVALHARVLLLPYLLLNGAIYLVLIRLGEPVWNEIVPGLLLGRRPTAAEARREAPGLAAVLDLTCEFDECRPLREHPGYRCLPVLDGAAPRPTQLDEGLRLIDEGLARGPTLVHCAMGHGRSATLVALHLVARGHAPDLAAAERLVRERRPRARLKPVQRRALARRLSA